MTDSVARLKELLFDRETATLTAIENRMEALAKAEQQARAELIAAGRQLEATTTLRYEELSRLEAQTRGLQSDLARRLSLLDQRTGTPEALRTSVAAVLDDVIIEARETKQEDLSRALAPMMVKTIKAELKNNQAEMVEALYPITGQLVKAYVASAMKDLTNRMNRRLQSNAVMLRMRSLFSGYSVAELALAETQQLEVEELYLVRRGSGELLQRWPASSMRSNSDIHMSSVMTAINDFATQAFQEDGGQLRSFNLDDFTVFLRASPLYLLAAKCRGSAAPGVDTLIDAEFLTAVAQQHEIENSTPPQAGQPPLHSKLLGDLQARLESGIAEKHEKLSRAGLPFNPVRALVATSLLALIGGLGWHGWQLWEQEATRSNARVAIAETTAMKGYPVLLEVAYGGRNIAISGVAPSDVAKRQLLTRLSESMPGVTVEDRGFAALPQSGPDMTPAIAAVRRDVTSLETQMTPAIAAVKRDVATLETQMTPAIAAVRRDVATLETQTARSATLRSLDRAGSRLGDALPELAALTSLVADPRRSSISTARTGAERTLTDLRKEQVILRTSSPDAGDTTRIVGALMAAADRMRTAAVTVSGITGPASAPLSGSKAGTRADLSLQEAAEEVSLAAERLATATAAALQAASLRIPAPPSARDRLKTYISANAVFFGNGDEFRDRTRATAVIAEVASLAREASAVIRVVGYTDESGGPNRNSPLAMSRAERVIEVLVARGHPRARIIAVGRATGPDLSPSTGPDSPNRRVEFEIGFDAEPIPGPR